MFHTILGGKPIGWFYIKGDLELSLCLSSVMTMVFVFKESKSLVAFIVVWEGEWTPWTSLHFKRGALPKICHLEIGKLQSGLFLWQFSFWCFWKKTFYVTFSFIKNKYLFSSVPTFKNCCYYRQDYISYLHWHD